MPRARLHHRRRTRGTGRIVVATINYGIRGYDAQRREALINEVRRRVEGLAVVERTALANFVPMSDGAESMTIPELSRQGRNR